ncbi:hypothetical protein [Anabaena sp. UHCC 0451]|uniref:hypothetical protein n=1 Tax=Anabaena sp. UHCC 0451 TaxID=2055235 RepID=UPI002B218BE3|nr:hypothetical protein [Anabaena sp. UHCC 0451]MEA5578308.1 hypothetical protein [Anabaena sp. UHCC 0451]
MTERKVNLEQSLIAQEKELLNPPNDSPIPEFALYRALRMAELAILGELERLNSSNKMVGLQLEYKVVEISDTATEEESQRLYEEAKLYSVAIGKALINSANSGNISNSLKTDVRDSLVERLYEYLNQYLLGIIPIKKLYLRLLINFSYPQPSVRESDRLRMNAPMSNLRTTESTNTNTLSFELSINYDPSCGQECNDGLPHLRINGRCKC